MPDTEFHTEFAQFIAKHLHVVNGKFSNKLIVFGDFNIDFNKKTKDMHIMNNYGLEATFSNTCTFFANGCNTQIDWCFTNIPKKSRKTIVYESYFSDHKPIWCCLRD